MRKALLCLEDEYEALLDEVAGPDEAEALLDEAAAPDEEADVLGTTLWNAVPTPINRFWYHLLFAMMTFAILFPHTSKLAIAISATIPFQS